jgi:hypothetical protein
VSRWLHFRQECVPLLELACRRGIVQAGQHAALKSNLDEIAKMLSGLINSLDKRDPLWDCMKAARFLIQADNAGKAL